MTLLALESTVISHGLPYPQNIVAARRFEQIAREHGAEPRTVAVIHGELRAGLGEASKAMGTADQIATYAVVLGEAAKTVINVMAGSRK